MNSNSGVGVAEATSKIPGNSKEKKNVAAPQQYLIYKKSFFLPPHPL
jgi:hypothetical protein